VPIFSLDLKKVLEAFRVHRIFKDNCANRVHEQKKKRQSLYSFPRILAFHAAKNPDKPD